MKKIKKILNVEAKEEKNNPKVINQEMKDGIKAEIHFAMLNDRIEAKFVGKNCDIAWMLKEIFDENEKIYHVMKATVKTYEEMKDKIGDFENLSLDKKIEVLGDALKDLARKLN